MGIFGSNAPRKRKSKRSVLNALNRRLAKKQKIIDKRKESLILTKAIEAARKKLRGY